MRVAIVGAGIAGLSAARALKTGDVECILFEAERHVGGRCATQRIGDYVFDPGATSIAPRGLSLEREMLEVLPKEELVLVEKPIFMHEALRVSPGDPVKNAVKRYTYRGGNQHLAYLLAEGLDVRLNTKVEVIEKGIQGGFRIEGEVFDAAVLTPPAPITADLLAGIGEVRPISHVRYRSCISVLLGYEIETPVISYHAIIDPEQRHPLTWLSVENVKCADRAPAGSTALVCQMSPAFSMMHFADEEEAIVELTTVYIERLYGAAWRHPKVYSVRRWQYSQPEMTAMFDSANAPGSKIVLAGDGFAGARVENAYESGQRAARLLLKQ